MNTITSKTNPLIKEVRTLCRKRDRWQKGLFIMEGIKLIDEAINNNVKIKNIFYSDKLHSTKDGVEFISKIADYRNLIYVPQNIMDQISNMENSQGIIATGYFNPLTVSTLNENSGRFLIFLDEVQDPGNMGTIIRSLDAFGGDGIILGNGCVDPFNEKVVRATMGSLFRVPLYFSDDGESDIQDLRKKGYRIYATSLKSSIPNYEASYDDKFVIIIGNEANGVSDALISISDESIIIPMDGNAESLNAGVAASIIMYEAMKQTGKKS